MPRPRKIKAWWQARHPLTDTVTLTQRNIYILPTRSGWFFALMLLVLLIASINYQLNLGYALTFLLAGSGMVSMYTTHHTLHGLELHLQPPSLSMFSGDASAVGVDLFNAATRNRYGVGLWIDSGEARRTWTFVDLSAGERTRMQLQLTLPTRGWHAHPIIRLETRFPFGLFRAFTLWRPAARLLVYPRPESPPVALPRPQGDTRGQERISGHAPESGDSSEDLRPWRRGDRMTAIVWKRAAQALASGGELIVRHPTAQPRVMLWLDWQDTRNLDTEHRLSRLTRWILDAEQSGALWGLRLPGFEAPPDAGESHCRRGLEKLALWTAP